MRRQRQEAGAESINLQAGRDISVVVNQMAGPAEDDENEVRVRVHRAFLYSDPRTPSCFFVNVFNASSVRETTVTHVWFETHPRTHALARKPGRVAPLSQWETWVEADALPFSLTRYEWLARVQLADGRVIESVPREDVPEVGYVPGEGEGLQPRCLGDGRERQLRLELRGVGVGGRDARDGGCRAYGHCAAR